MSLTKNYYHEQINSGADFIDDDYDSMVYWEWADSQQQDKHKKEIINNENDEPLQLPF